MTLEQAISILNNISDNATVFAESINGEFQVNSAISLVELSNDEKYLPTKQIAELKCPGYEYFMEVYLIKEFVNDLVANDPQMKPKDRVAQLIDYVKYDA